MTPMPTWSSPRRPSTRLDSPVSLSRAQHEARLSTDEKNPGQHGTISVPDRAYRFGPIAQMTRHGIMGHARVSPTRKWPGGS
jgi:hypothetical protein